MRTMQIGKDGRMVDMGDVPCEYDPFPPLAPEPTTDTSHDKVLDAAMRAIVARVRAASGQPDQAADRGIRAALEELGIPYPEEAR
jgi:hypothetical protein